MGRYLVPITPFLAVAAAYALSASLGGGAFSPPSPELCRRRPPPRRSRSSTSSCRRIRAWPHPTGSSRTLPGSRIANEHWDDSLPVGGRAQAFTLLELPVFEPDDDTKLGKLYAVLAESDYYVLSSPRAWRTIGRLPDRFPLMTRFYGSCSRGSSASASRLVHERAGAARRPARRLFGRGGVLGLRPSAR